MYTPTPEAPIRRVAPIRASSSGCGRWDHRAPRVTLARTHPDVVRRCANCDDKRAVELGAETA